MLITRFRHTDEQPDDNIVYFVRVRPDLHQRIPSLKRACTGLQDALGYDQPTLITLVLDSDEEPAAFWAIQDEVPEQVLANSAEAFVEVDEFEDWLEPVVMDVRLEIGPAMATYVFNTQITIFSASAERPTL